MLGWRLRPVSYNSVRYIRTHAHTHTLSHERTCFLLSCHQQHVTSSLPAPMAAALLVVSAVKAKQTTTTNHEPRTTAWSSAEVIDVSSHQVTLFRSEQVQILTDSCLLSTGVACVLSRQKHRPIRAQYTPCEFARCFVFWRA